MVYLALEFIERRARDDVMEFWLEDVNQILVPLPHCDFVRCDESLSLQRLHTTYTQTLRQSQD